MQKLKYSQGGFTLVEAIIVIVLTGIIAGFVALFLRRPVQQYKDLTLRAELTDAADTALRRISREVHLAVPNSVRSANNLCVEFIPSYDGGRYRTATNNLGGGNPFTTVQAISTFDVVGPLTSAPTAGDFVIVYNLGIPGADAYAPSDNRATVTAGSSISQINISSKQFPFASPGNKFQLVSGTERAVSYVCTGVGLDANGNGTGRLFRVSAYGFNYPEPSTCANTSSAPVIAQNISACEFNYVPGARERTGLLALRLSVSKSVSQSAETVSIYNDVNVNNVP